MSTLVLFLLLLICLLLGVPVAISLGLSSMLTLLLFSQDSLASMALKLFENLSVHYTLLAIPFFILSSAFLSESGVARRMIRLAVSLVGHIRGGLAMASVLACMLFAAVSGSSPATVAAIGTLVIAGMVQSGYSKTFAAGVIANAGTLGILIPPSIVMLVYAAATEVSAARLFMAGFVPGIALGILLMVAVHGVARYRGLPAQPKASLREVTEAFVSASGGLLLIVLVLGTIYGGIASPTEAAALSAGYAFLIACFGYRDLGPLRGVPWRKPGEHVSRALLRNGFATLAGFLRCGYDPEIRRVFLEAAKVSIMLLFVIANAMLFAHVLTTERIPHQIAAAMIGWDLPAWGFLIAVNLLLLAAGNFMEPSAIVLILAPILLPIASHLGIDPIHLGIIMVVNMEIGMVTPPVGLNLFVTAGITGETLGWTVRACLPWLLLLLGFLMVVTFVPGLSLWFPESLDRLQGYGN